MHRWTRPLCRYSAKLPEPQPNHFAQSRSSYKIWCMAKKTGMSSASLWIVTVLLLLLAAWTYFKK
jgi:hypothetical protein